MNVQKITKIAGLSFERGGGLDLHGRHKFIVMLCCYPF